MQQFLVSSSHGIPDLQGARLILEVGTHLDNSELLADLIKLLVCRAGLDIIPRTLAAQGLLLGPGSLLLVHVSQQVSGDVQQVLQLLRALQLGLLPLGIQMLCQQLQNGLLQPSEHQDPPINRANSQDLQSTTL